MSSALVFNQESNIVDTTASDDEGIPPQELLDLPAPSTSTSHINDRVFPITALPKEDGHREKNDNILKVITTVQTISDVRHISDSPKELKVLANHNIPSPSSSSSTTDDKSVQPSHPTN